MCPFALIGNKAIIIKHNHTEDVETKIANFLFIMVCHEQDQHVMQPQIISHADIQ